MEIKRFINPAEVESFLEYRRIPVSGDIWVFKSEFESVGLRVGCGMDSCCPVIKMVHGRQTVGICNAVNEVPSDPGVQKGTLNGVDIICSVVNSGSIIIQNLLKR